MIARGSAANPAVSPPKVSRQTYDGCSSHFTPPSTFGMDDKLPCPVVLYDIADDLGQKVSNICTGLFERQR